MELIAASACLPGSGASPTLAAPVTLPFFHIRAGRADRHRQRSPHPVARLLLSSVNGMFPAE